MVDFVVQVCVIGQLRDCSWTEQLESPRQRSHLEDAALVADGAVTFGHGWRWVTGKVEAGRVSDISAVTGAVIVG